MFNRPAKQRGQCHQIANVFPLADLGVEKQHARRLHIEKLQHPLLIPGHHAVIHTLQQAVHLIQMAVRFRQQIVRQERVANFSGRCQRQRQIRRGSMFRPATQRNRPGQPAMVVEYRR